MPVKNYLCYRDNKLMWQASLKLREFHREQPCKTNLSLAQLLPAGLWLARCNIFHTYLEVQSAIFFLTFIQQSHNTDTFKCFYV